jgi:hypothetical protein
MAGLNCLKIMYVYYLKCIRRPNILYKNGNIYNIIYYMGGSRFCAKVVPILCKFLA